VICSFLTARERCWIIRQVSSSFRGVLESPLSRNDGAIWVRSHNHLRAIAAAKPGATSLLFPWLYGQEYEEDDGWDTGVPHPVSTSA
jgi:hypothetical protein